METENQTVEHSHSHYHQQQTAPVLSLKDWMITYLLLVIPIVNIIMLFIWAFGDGENPNKANFAKAQLLWMVIVFGVSIIFFVFFVLIIGISISTADF